MVSVAWLETVLSCISEGHVLAVSAGHLCHNHKLEFTSVTNAHHLLPSTSSHWSFFNLDFFPRSYSGARQMFLSAIQLWWIKSEARDDYRRKQNKKQCWGMGAAVSFCKTINVACGGQKAPAAKTHLSSSSACVWSRRRGFLSVSRKNIFKCVWLLNVNLHNRWMSSTALHQQNAPVFQYAKSRAFTEATEQMILALRNLKLIYFIVLKVSVTF